MSVQPLLCSRTDAQMSVSSPNEDALVVEVVSPIDEQEETVICISEDRTWIAKWWQTKISNPMLFVLKSGTEPKQLSTSAALGISLGVFPIMGVTALLCGCSIAMLRSRCNPPLILLANLIATPLELSLIIPFLRLGELVTKQSRLLLAANSMWSVGDDAKHEILMGVLNSILGWVIAVPAIFGITYLLLLPVFSWAVCKFNSSSSAEEP